MNFLNAKPSKEANVFVSDAPIFMDGPKQKIERFLSSTSASESFMEMWNKLQEDWDDESRA